MADNNKLSADIILRVEGGGNLKGATGKGILNDISSILRSIEKNEASKLKIRVDEAYLKSQIQSALQISNASSISSSSVSARFIEQNEAAVEISTRKMSKATAQMNATKIAQLQEIHERKLKKAQEELDSEIKKNALKEENIRLSNERIKNLIDAQTQRQLKNNKREEESAKKRATSEIASIKSVQTQAKQYYEAHKSQISSNAELMRRYSSIMSGKFEYGADARLALNSWKKACVDAGVGTKSLGENIKELWNKFGGAVVSRLIIDGLSQAIRQSVQTVQELDKAVVNLSMVTGYSRAKTKELLETYVEMGQTLGATTTDVANSANEWLRQGYSIEETNKLIESSVILSKVGMLESAEATQYLTSALKGYKVDISDAITIVDKMMSVDMKAAVSTAGLAEAMSKTANSARLAGVDMDRLLGYIAAVGEVTQADPASVGTSFKTLFSRLSNIKLGKLEDENGEDITQSLSDAETVLNRVNIRLRDTATSYRDFGDVFDEIAGKWSSFNDIERNTIAMAFGGTRQKEQILTLFENYQNALGYAETAANSAGTAMQKYDAYVSGIEKSIKSFQASWESLVNHLIDSDLIKGTVDLGTNIVNILDGLTKIKLLLPTIISLALTAKNAGERMIENAGLCTLRKCA